MKKFLFALLALGALPAYSQWVLLNQIQETNVPDVEILDFTTPSYGTYIFVIDGITPTNTLYDIAVQVGIDNGISPIQWVMSYSGGVSTLRAGQTTIVSKMATWQGIPVTHVANAGTTFVGELRVANTSADTAEVTARGVNYGPVAIFGQGTFGVDGLGYISGTLNGSMPINCIRFVSLDPSAGSNAISSASISVYGLQESFP